MKLSGFIGKRILSTAGPEGYVLGVSTAGGALYLDCADCDEKEFTVDMQCVLSVKECIIFNGFTARPQNAMPVRLGRACFDMRGMYLGGLEDFTLAGGKLKTARIGKKNYPAEEIISGDIVIVKGARLAAPVKKNGKTLFKKGTCVTQELLELAAGEGEYVQTRLKSI